MGRSFFIFESWDSNTKSGIYFATSEELISSKSSNSSLASL